MLAEALVVPPGSGAQLLVLGDKMTVKLHGRDTGGAFTMIESVCDPDVGPPLHIHHREDEAFYVIAGEFEFVCNGERTVGGPGTVARLPRGVAHRFKNIGAGPGRLLITLTPAGLEEFFAEVGGLTAEQQADHPRLLEIAGRYGLEFVASV